MANKETDCFLHTGPLPSMVLLSRQLLLNISFVTLLQMLAHLHICSHYPHTGNAARLSHRMGLGCIPFRSPLLGESLLLSFPRGTEMFQFPRFPLPALYIQAGVTLHLVLGFPIRKSTDHSLVDDYPWLIAVSYVLHRLQAPRHPPLALNNLKDI